MFDVTDRQTDPMQTCICIHVLLMLGNTLLAMTL